MSASFRRPSARPRDASGIAFAMALAVLALLAVLAQRAYAEPRAKPPARTTGVALEDIMRDKLAPSVPAGLDVAKIYLPPALAKLALDPDKVSVEVPRALRVGRPSVKLAIRGRSPTWVPVAIAAQIDVAIAQRDLATGDVLTADDLVVEHRAVADFAPAQPHLLVGATVTTQVSAGAPIAQRDVALPPPLTRGTQVAIVVQRGAVRVRGTGILESAARPGESAIARLAATKQVVRGTLVAPATLLVGE